MNQSCDIEALLDTADLLLVQPDPAFADEASVQVDEPDNPLVGVLVRGRACDRTAGGPGPDDALRRIQADLEYLIANRPVIVADIGPILDASRAIELKTAHAANLAELLIQIRNRLVHGDAAITRTLAVPSKRGDIPWREEKLAKTGDHALPEAVLDSLIETARTQLRLLTTIRDAQAVPAHDQVMLQTTTGALRYTLPLSLDDTYSSTEVSEILSPTGKGHRTIAQNRRRANELLGVKIGSRYRYPKFQVDPAKHEIRPMVAYANRLLECDADPWGTLDWWFSGDEGLDGLRPIELLEKHELSERVLEFAIERGRQGMD